MKQMPKIGSVVAPDASVRGRAAEGAGGSVVLVGAGPGDADLLTLKAVRALQSADVILFDELVSDDVLELARREASDDGRQARGPPVVPQDDINGLMVKLARQGKRVVRLKAGDPMIFGRAGEEIARLEAAGIPVDVVPGITAALAGPRHRRFADPPRPRAFGPLRHRPSKKGEFPDSLDWRGLADPETSLVFYMGGRTAAQVAEKLLANGLPAATPVALAAAVTRPDEARWGGYARIARRWPMPARQRPAGADRHRAGVRGGAHRGNGGGCGK